jgi:hypothetical protein
MKITVEYLRAEIDKMTEQRDRAHDVAVAAQAGIDVMNHLISLIETPEPETVIVPDSEIVSV